MLFWLMWCVFLVIDLINWCVFFELIMLNCLLLLLLDILGFVLNNDVVCVFFWLILLLNDWVGLDLCFNLFCVGNCGFFVLDFLFLFFLDWDV